MLQAATKTNTLLFYIFTHTKDEELKAKSKEKLLLLQEKFSDPDFERPKKIIYQQRRQYGLKNCLLGQYLFLVIGAVICIRVFRYSD